MKIAMKIFGKILLGLFIFLLWGGVLVFFMNVNPRLVLPTKLRAIRIEWKHPRAIFGFQKIQQGSKSDCITYSRGMGKEQISDLVCSSTTRTLYKKDGEAYMIEVIAINRGDDIYNAGYYKQTKDPVAVVSDGVNKIFYQDDASDIGWATLSPTHDVSVTHYTITNDGAFVPTDMNADNPAVQWALQAFPLNQAKMDMLTFNERKSTVPLAKTERNEFLPIKKTAEITSDIPVSRLGGDYASACCARIVQGKLMYQVTDHDGLRYVFFDGKRLERGFYLIFLDALRVLEDGSIEFLVTEKDRTQLYVTYKNGIITTSEKRSTLASLPTPKEESVTRTCEAVNTSGENVVDYAKKSWHVVCNGKIVSKKYEFIYYPKIVDLGQKVAFIVEDQLNSQFLVFGDKEIGKGDYRQVFDVIKFGNRLLYSAVETTGLHLYTLTIQ